MKPALHRILVKGGVLTPSGLLRIIELVGGLGLDGLHFGSRQDILFPLPPDTELGEPAWNTLTVEALSDAGKTNIMSSYIAADIFRRTPWLTSATYLYILEQFDDAPTLEVNLTDPRQRLVPIFTGHLNFIAAPQEDYWYLYLRLPGWEGMRRLPALVHSWDVARVARAVEGLPDEVSFQEVVSHVNTLEELKNRVIVEELSVPFYPFPYYEGMNRVDASRYWLGLYWRNNWYDLGFLRAIAEQCLQNGIGKIGITPWKSLIINGIAEDRRLQWERLLGESGINVRHSSLELNWHLPVANGDALALKRYLVREFDQRDISTYGLTFGVRAGDEQPFTSLLIELVGGPGEVDGFPVRPLYNLLYARDFDPNSREYIEYAQRIDRSELADLLIELSRRYFSQLDTRGKARIATDGAEPPPPTVKRSVFACDRCGNLYDPAHGDPDAQVPAGTAPDQLPADYRCWTCEAPLSSFSPASY